MTQDRDGLEPPLEHPMHLHVAQRHGLERQAFLPKCVTDAPHIRARGAPVVEHEFVQAKLGVGHGCYHTGARGSTRAVRSHVGNCMAGSALDVTLDELEQAAQFVHRTMPPTPQYSWPKLKARAGCTVWVKHENHTPTGAFKVRGGLVYMHRLLRSAPGVAGIVSATRGNHGQSISFAAARAKIPATIYVPLGNSPDQNSAMRAFGATVVEVGRDFDEAKHEAKRAAAERDLHFVP